MIALRSFLTPKESKASFATHRTHTGAWKFDAAFGILCPFCSIRFSSKVPTFILKLTCWSTNFNRAKKGRNIFPKERAFELVCSKIFWFYAMSLMQWGNIWFAFVLTGISFPLASRILCPDHVLEEWDHGRIADNCQIACATITSYPRNRMLRTKSVDTSSSNGKHYFVRESN